MNNKDYAPAGADVVALCQELINRYHEGLMDARIGLLMKLETSMKDGRAVLGKTRKLPADLRVYLPYDFIIWLDENWWGNFLTDLQRRALLDHQLCHCSMNPEQVASIRPHDIEEFAVIIQRYGFWQPSDRRVEHAIQARFEFLARAGKVEAFQARYMGFLFDVEATDEYALPEAPSAPVEAPDEALADESMEDAPASSGEAWQPSLMVAGEDGVDPEAPAMDVDILDQVDGLLGGNPTEEE